MCLIFVAIGAHPNYPLIIAANRDEFYNRPTARASFWPEAPDLLAGRDLRAGGTWLGITRNGRVAALTNYRDTKTMNADAPSRGRLVSDFLLGRQDPVRYLEQLSRSAHIYNGFSLIAGIADKMQLFYYSNRGNGIRMLGPGIHGLSNHLLDTAWPKVEKGKQALRGCLAKESLNPESLLQLLLDRATPPDDSLPETGVGLEWERILSPVFITSPDYGTRSSTVILLDKYGSVTFVEKSFDKIPEGASTAKYLFVLKAPAEECRGGPPASRRRERR